MWLKAKAWLAVERNRTRAARWALGIYALFIINWLVSFLFPFVFLRFTSSVVNSLTLALALLLPFVAAALLLPLTKPRRQFAFLGLLLLGMGSLPIIAGIVFGIVPAERGAKNDPSFEFVRQVTRDGPAVRVYRTDEGAWSSFGIVVQQETTIVPGLVWVRRLTSEYPADDVQITVLDRHHIRCSFPPYNDLRPKTDVVTVWTD